MSIKKLITGLTLSMLLASGCSPLDTALIVIPVAVSVTETLVSEVEKGIHQRKERKANRLFNEKIAASKRQDEDKAGAYGQTLSGGTYSRQSGNASFNSSTQGSTPVNNSVSSSLGYEQPNSTLPTNLTGLAGAYAQPTSTLKYNAMENSWDYD